MRPGEAQGVERCSRKRVLFKIMTPTTHARLSPAAVTALPDSALIARLGDVALRLRRNTAEIIMLLAEVESRGLHLRAGCSSLFMYCTHVLRFSENEAYHRIQAAHAARRFPDLLRRMESGDLTLTAITLLRPHLTIENYDSVVSRACGKTKREIEDMVASIAPKPAAPSLVRRIPTALTPLSASPVKAEQRGQQEWTSIPDSAPQTDSSSPRTEPPTPASDGPVVVAANSAQPGRAPTPPRALISPLSPDRYLLRVTVTAETHAKLRYAQNLARHSVPSGDLATILDRALTLFVRDLERVKLARVDRPRRTNRKPDARTVLRSGAAGRRIPSEIRRAVWLRDGGRCTFTGPAGQCGAVGWLEFHHIVPFAAGGPATAENITLRCRAHNQYEADAYFKQDSRSQAPAGG